MPGPIHPGRHMQVIGAVLLQDRGQAQGIVQGPAAVHVIVAVDPQTHGEILTAFGLDVGQKLQKKPDAVFERTAVSVRAVVGIGGEKLVDQIAVGRVHLDEIESGIPAAASRVSERSYQFGDFVDGQLSGGSLDHGQGGNRRRRHFLVVIGLAPAVHQLYAKADIVGFDAFGHFGKGRDAPLVPQGGQVGKLQAGGMNSGAAHKDHSGAALGPGRKIFGQLIGHVIVLVHAEVDAHGGHEQPVLGFHRPDLDGIEKVLENRHGCLPFLI